MKYPGTLCLFTLLSLMKLFLTVILMEILAGAEIDLFVPSFPALQDSFNISPFLTELLLGINLIAYCFTSLIVGNLGDYYGRRPIILLGLVIFNLASLLCMFSNNYSVLLIGRFLQGTGISAVAVLAYLVIADVYSITEQQRIIGILNGIITLSMAFAPVIGSYINLFFGWQGSFTLLFLLGMCCFILSILYIPKEGIRCKSTFSVKEYAALFKSTKAIYYILTMTFFAQGYWIFIGVSPILYMRDLGVTLEDFGLYQGSLAAIFSIMSFTSSYFFKKFGVPNCFYAGIAFVVLYLFAVVAMVILKIHNPLAITLVTLLLTAGVIYPINILWPLMLEAIPDAKARITAIFTAARLILTALGLQIVGFIYNGTYAPIGITIFFIMVAGLLTCYKIFKYDKVFERSIQY